jgi:hypothetical protein
VAPTNYENAHVRKGKKETEDENAKEREKAKVGTENRNEMERSV